MRAALWLPVLLAGCFWGHCGLTITDVTWNDPALYEALDVAPTAPDGMAWNATGLSGWLQSARVTELRWQAFSHGPSVVVDATLLRMDEQGADVPKLRFEEAIDRLAQVADVDDETRQRLVEALEASRTHWGSEMRQENGTWVETPLYSYAVAHGLDVEPRRVWGEDAEPAPAPGARRGAWFFSFDHPAKAVELEGHTLRVDAIGHVSYDRTWPEETPFEDARADVERALADAGLPVPEHIDFQGVVC